MRNKRIIIGILTAGLMVLAVTPSFGQIIYGEPSAGSLRMVYSHWNMDGESGKIDIDQFTVPVSGFIPLSDNFETRFYMAGSTNVLSYYGSDSSLSGLSDFRIQASRSFSDDRILASIGLNLPVGKRKLDPYEERAVIDVLSQNYLDFPLRRLGEGLGVNMLLGGAAALGRFQCGAGMSYQFNGSYTPYEDGLNYKPGNFFSINANAATGGDRTNYSLDMVYTLYGTDKYDGDKIFKQSQQFDIRLAGAYGETDYSLNGYVRYLIRGRHTRYDITSGAVISELKMYGNEFSINGAFTYRPGTDWYIGPNMELKIIGGFEEIDQDVDGATVFGTGIMYGRNFGRDLSFDLGFKYFTGSAYGGDMDLSGFQITAGLAAGF
nr:hypothetical protein [candidate division Zixibacteria bacterium]